MFNLQLSLINYNKKQHSLYNTGDNDICNSTSASEEEIEYIDYKKTMQNIADTEMKLICIKEDINDLTTEFKYLNV